MSVINFKGIIGFTIIAYFVKDKVASDAITLILLTH